MDVEVKVAVPEIRPHPMGVVADPEGLWLGHARILDEHALDVDGGTRLSESNGAGIVRFWAEHRSLATSWLGRMRNVRFRKQDQGAVVSLLGHCSI
jgi:hypothetical protein